MWKKIFAVCICALFIATLFIGALPMVEGVTVEPNAELTFDYWDGSDVDETLTFEYDTNPYAMDYQRVTPKIQYVTNNYIRIENTGAISFQCFKFNILGLYNGSNEIDMDKPGMWAIDYGDWDYFTSGHSVDNHNYTVCTVGDNYSDEITHKPGGQGTQLHKKIHSVNETWKNKGQENRYFKKYTTAHTRDTSDSPIIFNSTLEPDDYLYIRVILLLDNVPDVGTWILDFECTGYDDYDSISSFTRAVASDTLTGTSLMSISSTIAFTVSYTGTHTDEVYFTKVYGGVSSTVTAVNNFRITNTGNEIITAVGLDVGSAVWEIQSSGSDTLYSLSGNTYFRREGVSTWVVLSPSSLTSVAIPVSGYEDFNMQIRNEPDLSVESYVPSIAPVVTVETSTGSSSDGSLSMVYTVAGGTLDTSLTYSTGSAATFPNSVPGDLDVEQSNYGYVNVLGTSDYPVDAMEFLFRPLEHVTIPTYEIPYSDNADITIIDADSNSFTYALTSFSSGGLDYGRVLIAFDDSDPTKPNVIGAGEYLTFSVTFYEIPIVIPGSYEGDFIITSSYNPISILNGTAGFGVDLSGDIVDFKVVYEPTTPRVGDTMDISFNIWTTTNTTLYGDYHIVITDKESDIEVVDKIVKNVNYSDLTNTTTGNRRTCLNEYEFTPNNTGAYNVKINYTVLNPGTLEWEDLEIGNQTNFTVKSKLSITTWLEDFWNWILEYWFWICVLVGGAILFVYFAMKSGNKATAILPIAGVGNWQTINAQTGGFALSSGVCCLMIFVLIIAGFVLLYYLVKVLRGNGG